MAGSSHRPLRTGQAFCWSGWREEKPAARGWDGFRSQGGGFSVGAHSRRVGAARWEPPGELTVCSTANFTFPNLSCSTQGSRMILAPLSRAFCRGDGGGKGPQGWTPPERLPAAPR